MELKYILKAQEFVNDFYSIAPKYRTKKELIKMIAKMIQEINKR